MNNGSISITLSTGPITINANTLNYRPIKKLLESGKATEEQLTNLLSVSAPNGIFYALTYKNWLYIQHIDPKTYQSNYFSTNEHSPVYTIKLPCTIEGAYASKEELLADFPEYFI